MELRTLDEPAQTIAVPGEKPFEQEQALEQRRIVADRRPAELKRRGQVRQVEQARGLAGNGREQPRQNIERPDVRHVSHVPGNQRFDVAPMPVRPAPVSGTKDRRRETAGCDALRKLGTEPLRATDVESATEQKIHKLPAGRSAHRLVRCARSLPLRQWMKPNDLQTPRKRLGQLRQEQHVRRTREQETTGDPPPVHVQFDRLEQLRRTLDLVQDNPVRQLADETRRIVPGTVAGHGVVQTDVGVTEPVGTGRQHAGQRRLAALSRTMDEDDRRVFQGLDESALDQTWEQARLRHRLIVRSSVGRLQVWASADCRFWRRQIASFGVGRLQVQAPAD